jgi:hypothetical protein
MLSKLAATKARALSPTKGIGLPIYPGSSLAIIITGSRGDMRVFTMLWPFGHYLGN